MTWRAVSDVAFVAGAVALMIGSLLVVQSAGVLRGLRRRPVEIVPDDDGAAIPDPPSPRRPNPAARWFLIGGAAAVLLAAGAAALAP